MEWACKQRRCGKRPPNPLQALYSRFKRSQKLEIQFKNERKWNAIRLSRYIGLHGVNYDAKMTNIHEHLRSIFPETSGEVLDWVEVVQRQYKEFQMEHKNVFDSLAPLALDLLASEAYVERIFFLCGLLTAGRRKTSWRKHWKCV